MTLFRFLLPLFALLAFSLASSAQELSSAQRATLRAAFFAEPALQEALAVRSDDPVTAYCNTPVTPAKLGWKTSIQFADLFEATDLNVYIARSVAERDAYNMLLNAARDNPAAVSAARANVRSGILNIFSGTASAVVTARRAILAALTEPVTWCQEKLGTALAATDTINGHVRVLSRDLTGDEVSIILNGD